VNATRIWGIPRFDAFDFARSANDFVAMGTAGIPIFSTDMQ
jgi:hypothetical protein